MGDRAMTGLIARELLKDSVTVKTCGIGLYKKNGYGRFLGWEISDLDGIKKAIKELSLKGIDFIKVFNSGIVSLKATNLVTPGGFNREELYVICAEAGERGLSVHAHANTDRSVRNAVEAGVASIEHGLFISSETIDLMRDQNVMWTPTVFAFVTAIERESGGRDAIVEKMLTDYLSMINYAASIGIRLRIGTDSGSKGVKHGESFVFEMEFLQKAGLSPQQIELAATVDG